jgi:hypothetical protein
MRTVLITFLVSTVASVVLWQFGLAHRIWPVHPFLATLGIAVGCGIVVQLVLSQASASKR